MRIHFLHRHVQDTVVILEEGNLPHTRCPRCDMLVPGRTLNGRNLVTAQCDRGADRKRSRLAEEEFKESTKRGFQVYVEPFDNVTVFRYLGLVMTVGDNDWPAVVGNIHKTKKSWGQLSRILIREGADSKVSGHFFKAVTQAVLLFRTERWVLTPRMELDLSIFQHRVAQRIIGRQTR